MGDVWALIPVKRLEQAKSRLASVLQPEECAMLSRAMLMDVLAALGFSTSPTQPANTYPASGIASSLYSIPEGIPLMAPVPSTLRPHDEDPMTESP